MAHLRRTIEDEGGARKVLEVLKWVSPTVRSKEEKQNGKKAISCGQDFPTSKEASVVDEATDTRQATHELSQECPRN